LILANIQFIHVVHWKHSVEDILTNDGSISTNIKKKSPNTGLLYYIYQNIKLCEACDLWELKISHGDKNTRKYATVNLVYSPWKLHMCVQN